MKTAFAFPSRVASSCGALFLAVVVLAIGLAPRPALASPEDLFGYGARSPGMGATGPASAEGFEATYANPALLSRLRDRKLSLGWQGATFHLTANGPGLPGLIPYDAAKGVTIGVGLPLPFGGILKDRIGAGLAFYTPTQVLVRGNILYPETPQFSLLPDRAQLLAIQLGLGLDVGYGIRVGVGFSTVAELLGTVVAATDATGHVGTRVEDQLIAVYAPILGLSYDLPLGKPHTWRVGATYRGKLAASFLVSLDGTKLTSLNIPVLNIGGLAQYDPAQIAVEAAYDGKDLLVALGATYKRWSQYPGPLEATLTCPGSDPTCSALTPATIGYHDTVAIHVGADHPMRFTPSLTAHVRAGYFLEPTPLPSSLPSSTAYSPTTAGIVSLPTRYYDATRHAITAGGGVDLSRLGRASNASNANDASADAASETPTITLDLYGQLHLLQPRTMTFTPDATGNAGTTSQASVGGHVLLIGMVVGAKF